MVPGDILCRDDSLQASSIVHVTRRRHSHMPSGRVRRSYDSCSTGCPTHRLTTWHSRPIDSTFRRTFLVDFSLTLPTRTGARVCGIDIFTPTPSTQKGIQNKNNSDKESSTKNMINVYKQAK
ncbi:hypothetical protein EVAR_43542_1 [Eumeta japonica]|uniref:Uncharacterized protein n=1 Tax=Eumeta variegata TaxID=151549 RepID=A0A4C1W9Y7_EUMVA|nr:hypothetical protein EVAR_43542_1 [Eumeta japonica]